jgi:L-lactate dehydrogenase complex protein LldF
VTSVDTEARRTLPSPEAVRRHDGAVFDLRRRRDLAVAEVPDWEALRERAAKLKAHTLDHLDTLLERFEEQARDRGAYVHWAESASDLGHTVAGILKGHGARRVAKSKSMLTEECGLNPFLEARGFDIVDTDLGERIVQLGHEAPSHIIVPAIHRTRGEIGALFHEKMGTPEGEDDPVRLTRHARADLRARFLAADAGITGANFAVAETGSLVVVTNEGNADLGMALPPLHIACVGIEKLVPALADLPVFLRLLARSATGQPISAYTTLVTGPRPDSELHIVLVDNGRSRLLADPGHRQSLGCIRCGACLNTCPVYRRAGGHAYPGVIPGPIGAVLRPAGAESREDRAVAQASSLCGSCTAVCPVRIDLHGQLLAWRREQPSGSRLERVLHAVGGTVLSSRRATEAAGRAARGLWPLLHRRFPGNPAEPWLRDRELPELAAESFRARWRREREGPGG